MRLVWLTFIVVTVQCVLCNNVDQGGHAPSVEEVDGEKPLTVFAFSHTFDWFAAVGPAYEDNVDGYVAHHDDKGAVNGGGDDGMREEDNREVNVAVDGDSSETGDGDDGVDGDGKDKDKDKDGGDVKETTTTETETEANVPAKRQTFNCPHSCVFNTQR